LSTSDRGIARRSLRRIALAGVVSLSMIGLAGVASAQDAETAPAAGAPAVEQPVEQPAEQPAADPATEAPAEDTPAEEQQPAESEDEGSQTPPDGTDESTDEESPADEPAAEEPPVTLYDVSLQTDCYDDGYGFVYVYVRTYDENPPVLTATVEGESEEFVLYAHDEESGLRVFTADFEGLSAGSFPVRVTGEGVDVTANADLTGCEPDRPAPDDHFSVSVSCVDGNGVVTIQLYVPNDEMQATDESDRRTYTITVDDFILDPYYEYPFIEGVVAKITEIAPDGTFMIGLYDGERLIDEQEITVACAVATTLPPTTPPAQGAPAPGGGGGLADTGAAVGGLAALGGLALVLGGALVLTGRRRAARVTND